MSKSKKDQFLPEKDKDNEDLAEIITVNNGVKQLNVTKKAFNAVYSGKGFVLGKLTSSKIDDYPSKKSSSDEVKLSPQQKAAQTKAENTAKAEAENVGKATDKPE